MISRSQIRREILLEGLHDDHGLWWLLRYFDDLPNPDARRAETLGLVRELLENGWFEPGFPTRDGRGFNAWNVSAEAALARISKEWDELDREPTLGDIVWLRLTSRGEEEARKYEKRA